MWGAHHVDSSGRCVTDGTEYRTVYQAAHPRAVAGVPPAASLPTSLYPMEPACLPSALRAEQPDPRRLLQSPFELGQVELGRVLCLRDVPPEVEVLKLSHAAHYSVSSMPALMPFKPSKLSATPGARGVAGSC